MEQLGWRLELFDQARGSGTDGVKQILGLRQRIELLAAGAKNLKWRLALLVAVVMLPAAIEDHRQ